MVSRPLSRGEPSRRSVASTEWMCAPNRASIAAASSGAWVANSDHDATDRSLTGHNRGMAIRVPSRDLYADLGVGADRVARGDLGRVPGLARELHPDAHPRATPTP